MARRSGALRGLTPRGRAFCAGGVILGLVALLLGQSDLLRVAVLLIALPLVAAIVLARARFRLQMRRQLGSHRVTAGGLARVTLALHNTGRLPTGVLLGEDELPGSLGTAPRFVLERMTARWQHKLRYRVRADLRGRYEIGPLNVRVTDPFGLVEQTTRFDETDTLLVVPAVTGLPWLPVPGEQASTGESSTRAVTSAGDQDLTVREYHQGDDLRRVHWRSTARRGELMVRPEEQPWRARATILLDNRATAHVGSGLTSSLEWAVSAAASIGTHLVSRGYELNLVDHNARSLASISGMRRGLGGVPGLGGGGDGGSAEIALLDALACVRPARRRGLGEYELAGDTDSIGLLIMVVGRLTRPDLDALVRMQHRATTALALVMDVAGWQASNGTASAAQPPTGRLTSTGAAPSVAQASRHLQLAGVRTVVAGPASQLPALWQDLLVAGGTAVPTTPRVPA